MSPAFRQECAAFIRESIETSGYHQHEVARLVGVHPPAVSRWVTGRRCPDEATIRLFCAALKIPVENFFRRVEAAQRHAELP